ncbi:MAG: hypothetical protein A2Z25_08670 [Planctomycetes bacterium RBG_16_55_9]|nr:MAG: hypothetical protein A2Z25_08670 [Planctomycetes bacterium RBG_16_55_9]
MSFKNQKNLIAVGGIVIALVIGTVLLGGFAKNESAAMKANEPAGVCPAMGCGGCPMAKAEPAAFAEVSESEQAKTEASCCGEPCPLDCPKPCCKKQTEPRACCGSEKVAATQ